MSTKTLTIAEALVYKKRVIEALTLAQGDILGYNSVLVVKENDSAGIEISRHIDRQGIEIRWLIDRRDVLKQHLMDLKLGLWRASETIRGKILALAEFKSDIQFWNSMTTTHGMASEPDRWASPDEMSERDAIVKRDEVREIVRQLKKSIDATQREIDKFNYTNGFDIADIGEL